MLHPSLPDAFVCFQCAAQQQNCFVHSIPLAHAYCRKGMPGSAPDDVVHGEQQRVVVGCDLDQHHAQRHLLHQPEGPVGLAVDQCARCALSALSAHAVPLQHGQRARVLSRQHRLQQAPVALQQPCAQDLVPGRQGAQRGLQRARIQRPAQAQRLRHVVGGAVGVHVVQRNHLRLVG